LEFVFEGSWAETKKNEKRAAWVRLWQKKNFTEAETSWFSPNEWKSEFLIQG
jgi:hypothetical protein